jgi:hypothetical protein
MLLLTAAVSIVVIGGLAELWVFRASPPSTISVAPPATAPQVVAPTIPIRTADEATIRANRSADLDVFRFAQNKAILVLDFASLKRQGAMLNRIAAMAEKVGAPHDHPLNDADLDHAIRAGGDTPENFYYGHDYSAAELSQFFTMADQEKLVLSSDEEWMRRLLRQEGFFEPGSRGALITIPAQGAASDIDAATREAILHHELSHGEYFSNPAYATYVLHFWREMLSNAERGAFTRFLTSENYDPELRDLLANETQAYLLFTPDARLFAPAMIGMDDAKVVELRERFRNSMPQGWLRDELLETVAH